ncbi:hypothetical protein [Nocardioides bigeumensis]|uniref:Uncharacterized protein n=1 Tax=Nocardioides bigeumensis TaxID=433657 RepID=A0ABN2XXT1_9ACTN
MPETHDPFDDLRDVAVRPLPAAEIRARGDRLRRRRATLAVLGAAASVALVAGVIGAIGSPGDQVLPAPAPATTSPSATPGSEEGGLIPADFPLGAGLPGEPQIDRSPEAMTSIGLCDALVPAEDGLDGISLVTEVPAGVLRTLQVYASSAEARAVVADARAAVVGCPRDSWSDGTRLRNDPVPFDTGEASFAFSERRLPTESLQDHTFYHLVAVGSAVVLQMTHVTDPGLSQPLEVEQTLVPVVEAMTIFSDVEALPPTGSANPGANPEANPGANPGAIPADFPLDVDQVAMEGDGGEKRGPSPDETGLDELTLCGAPIFADDPAERLASTATGPEYADIRELRVYPTADEAAEQITMLRARISTDCSQPVDGGGRLVNVPIQADTGYDTVTWADYYTRGLGGGPVQFTRVGRAVLAVALRGEFSEASLDGAGDTVTEVTLKITPAMCVFTEDGCGGGPSEPEYLAMSHGQAGPFVMGMQLRAVRKQATTLDDSGRCVSFTWEPESLPHLTGVVDPDRGVVSLASSDQRFITAEGVEVGATYAEVRDAYPDATGDRVSLVADLGEGAYYRFDLKGGRVATLELALWDQSCVG